MALNARQRRFVQEYCRDWNASQAAVRAGYASKRGDQSGYQLLRNIEIQQAIRTHQQELQGQFELSQETIVTELMGIAFSDLRRYVQWGPDGIKLEPSDRLAPAHARVVAEVSQTVTQHGGTVRLKLHSKIEALDRLCRHLGLFRDQLHLTDTWTEPRQSAQEVQEALLRRLDELSATDHQAAQYRTNGRH